MGGHMSKSTRNYAQKTISLANATLWKTDWCPACRTVLMTLDALNVNVEEVEVEQEENKKHIDKILQKNKFNTLPIYQDEDLVIGECHAICAFLVNHYFQDGRLLPLEVGHRAVVEQMMHYNCGVILPRLRTIAHPLFNRNQVHPSHSRIVDVEASYNTLECFLNSTPNQKWFNQSNKPMLSDICLGASISSLNVLVPIGRQRYVKLHNWLDRLSDEDFYQSGNVGGLDIFENKLKELIR